MLGQGAAYGSQPKWHIFRLRYICEFDVSVLVGREATVPDVHDGDVLPMALLQEPDLGVSPKSSGRRERVLTRSAINTWRITGAPIFRSAISLVCFKSLTVGPTHPSRISPGAEVSVALVGGCERKRGTNDKNRRDTSSHPESQQAERRRHTPRAGA